MRDLSLNEMEKTTGGEAITLASIMALMAVGIVTVVCYRLFKSGNGKVSLPGPFSFTWGQTKGHCISGGFLCGI